MLESDVHRTVRSGPLSYASVCVCVCAVFNQNAAFGLNHNHHSEKNDGESCSASNTCHGQESPARTAAPYSD